MRIAIRDIDKNRKITPRDMRRISGGGVTSGNEFSSGGEGLNAGDALLLEYDKNSVGSQSEISNVMGKALTEVQSSMSQRLQYMSR